MVDLSFLKKFTKGDSKKMKRYISLYLDVTPKTFEKMEFNLENEDWDQLRIYAHSLKPQADFMGISSLKNVLIEIEEAVKKNNFDAISKHFDLAKDISINSAYLLNDIIKEL